MRLEVKKYLFDIRFQKNVQHFPGPKSLKPEGSMGNIWQVQEAKARFRELLEASRAEGPQIVTKHGKKTAVLAPEPRTEALTPPRRKLRLRPAPDSA